MPSFKKVIRKKLHTLLQGNNYLKVTKVKVALHKTAFPSGSKNQLALGIRLDSAGPVQENGVDYNKFQLQLNEGKISAPLKRFRDENGGTHAILATLKVKKDGTKDDVRAAINKALKSMDGGKDDDDDGDDGSDDDDDDDELEEEEEEKEEK